MFRRSAARHHGVAGRVGAGGRALTCSAVKPQGLPPGRLAQIAESFARGGLDFVKDDHGLADQEYSRFADRVGRCAEAVRRAAQETGHATQYVPSLSGDLETMRDQIRVARDAGVGAVMVAPMVSGFANFHSVVRENPATAFMAHPSMAGAARIAPELLIGKLFPLIGADAVIFPNHGGRFGYTAETCRRLSENARGSADGGRGAIPVPAGGMTVARVAEMLDFYGPDTMLLLGGSLLAAGEGLVEATSAFARAVSEHIYR